MAAAFAPKFAMERNAALLLADGAMFWGVGIGAKGVCAGELCFTTGMSGYQETLTDPSFAGQIITFTFPHIGNVGSNEEDIESRVERIESGVDSSFTSPHRGENSSFTSPHRREDGRGASDAQSFQTSPPPSLPPNGGGIMPNAHRGACGLIIREAITEPSNFRSTGHLNDWLIARRITGISGIDTRLLTAHLREHGAQNGVIVFESREGRVESLVEKGKMALACAPDMNGLELAVSVSRRKSEEWSQGLWKLGAGFTSLDSRLCPLDSPHIIAIDFGMKENIARNFVSLGCRVTILPATSSAKEILALKPDGVFLSNGPGDPSATGEYAVPVIRAILDANVPIFGICLGHQLLGLALGARTQKMAQGHRGANHPIKNLATGKVEITAQNHGFAVSKEELPSDVEITHVSLFDGTIAGLRHKTKPVFSVQYHPESSPGPHDSRYLFAQFVEMMKKSRESRIKSRVEGKIA